MLVFSLGKSGVLEDGLGTQGDGSVEESLGPSDLDGFWKVGGNHLLVSSCMSQKPFPQRLRNRQHCHAFAGDVG